MSDPFLPDPFLLFSFEYRTDGNNDMVIPSTIDIKKYIIFEQNDYDFHGMILRSGSSEGTGHFSLLLHCGNGKWMFLDDQHKSNDVVELDEKDLEKFSLSRHPDVMVYRRRLEADTETHLSTNFVWRIAKRDQEIISQQLFPMEIEKRKAKTWWDINKVMFTCHLLYDSHI